MIWIDVALRAAALASAIIATLRAGSRVVYLIDHDDGIGIMDGPVIQNTSDTYPLFELSEAFRHCVRLSMAPEQYENVRWRQPVEEVVEPYPLAPRPHIPQQRQADKEEEERIIPDLIEGDQDTQALFSGDFQKRGSFWSRSYQTTLQRIQKLPSSISGTYEYLAMMPQAVSYHASRLWHWKRGRAKDSSDIVGDEEGKNGAVRLVSLDQKNRNVVCWACP